MPNFPSRGHDAEIDFESHDRLNPLPQPPKLKLALKSNMEKQHSVCQNENPAARNHHILSGSQISAASPAICCGQISDPTWKTTPRNGGKIQYATSTLSSLHFLPLNMFRSLLPALYRSPHQTRSQGLTRTDDHRELERLLQTLAHDNAEPGCFPSNTLETQDAAGAEGSRRRKAGKRKMNYASQEKHCMKELRWFN